MNFRYSVSRSLAALLVLALFTAVSSVWGAGLSAEPDRTRLGLNETFTLRIIAEGGLKGEADLSPLDQDFEILNRSTSSRMTIINGDMRQTRELALELAPRRVGELQVPALSLGGEQTQPIQIRVVPADEVVAAGAPRPVFVDTAVEDAKPYVQQAFIYRVKVFYSEQPRRATLSEPIADGATVEQMGDDRGYTEMIDGQRYTIIERRYLVVPQRSGPLTIRSPRLEVVLPDNRPGARRGPFSSFDDIFGGQVFQGFPTLSDMGGGRRVMERGPDQVIDVRPQPTAVGSLWLPAQSVELSDEWNPSPPRLRVGEPVTRTLTITAQGATAAQLPTLDSGSPEGANVYPEQPQSEELPGGDSPASLKSVKIALVPTRAGTLTLPEIRLPWWDTVQDRERVAVIPQRTLEVAPGVAGVSAPQPAPRPAPLVESPAPAPSPLEAGASTGSSGTPLKDLIAPQGQGRYWPWLALVFGLGWLVTLVWWLRERSRGSLGKTANPTPSVLRVESLDRASAAVRQACTSGDPRAARAALLAWGRARWPQDPPGGLGELGARIGGDARTLQADIDRALYAPDGTLTGQNSGVDWDGAAIWLKLAPLLRAAQSNGRQDVDAPLPGLYPR